MSQVNIITCDQFQRDLTTSTNSVDYRLKLMNEYIAPHDGAVTDMMIVPPLTDGDKHFCVLGCLYMWINKL